MCFFSCHNNHISHRPGHSLGENIKQHEMKNEKNKWVFLWVKIYQILKRFVGSKTLAKISFLWGVSSSTLSILHYLFKFFSPFSPFLDHYTVWDHFRTNMFVREAIWSIFCRFKPKYTLDHRWWKWLCGFEFNRIFIFWSTTKFKKGSRFTIHYWKTWYGNL